MSRKRPTYSIPPHLHAALHECPHLAIDLLRVFGYTHRAARLRAAEFNRPGDTTP